MRRKSRLIISIIIFILVAILVGMGLWAVLGGDISIGGDIYFSSTDLEVTIKGRLYGHKKSAMTKEDAEILPGATWTASTAQDGIANSLDWTDLQLNFADKNSPIIIEVEIANNHYEESVIVGVSDKTETEDKNFTVDISNYGTIQKNTITPGETITYLIVLRIVNIAWEVDGKLDIIFSLSNIV